MKNYLISAAAGILMGIMIGYALHGNKTADANALADSIARNNHAYDSLKGYQRAIKDRAAITAANISTRDSIIKKYEKRYIDIPVERITDPDSAYSFLKAFAQ